MTTTAPPRKRSDSKASPADAREPSTAESEFGKLPPSPMKAMARLGGWRILRSMRTAIWLLLALVIATTIPTLIPQRITNAAKVAEISQTHPGWYQVADRLRLFDVFNSPWYVAIYGSLLFVLLCCLIPRSANFVRNWRRAVARPKPGPLPALSHTSSFQTDTEPQLVEPQLRKGLRRAGFRCGRSNENQQWIAEKGWTREAGSLIFHWSFFVLMAGLFVTRAFGFTGFAVIVEGKTWVEAPIGIDEYNPGWYGDNTHQGFQIALDKFEAKFRPEGGAMDFVSHVRVIDNGKEIAKDIRVNDPLSYRGIKMYQTSFGWATRIVVADPTGQTVFDDFITLAPKGPRNSWTGVVKVPGLRPQGALEVFFLPTAELISDKEARAYNDELGPGVRLQARPGPPTANSPAIVFKEYRGDLGLDGVAQNVSVLDKSRLGNPVDAGGAGLAGRSFQTTDGLSVTFPELRHYSVFQVKHDPGLVVMLIAASLIMLGLVPSLWVSRRRLWVWVRPAESGSGSTVTLGGLAYQKKDAFEREFNTLTKKMNRRLGTGTEQHPTLPEQVTLHNK